MRAFAILLVLLASESITAAEEPCRAEGDRVSCERVAFDALMRKVVDSRAERDVLKVKLDAAVADGSDAHRALDACIAKPPPEPVVVRPSALEKVGPVVLGVLGSGVLGITAMMDGQTAGRAVGAVVGFLSVGAGLYWAMP